VIYKAEWNRVLLCVPKYFHLPCRGSAEVRRGLGHYIGIASVMLDEQARPDFGDEEAASADSSFFLPGLSRRIISQRNYLHERASRIRNTSSSSLLTSADLDGSVSFLHGHRFSELQL
jgi:hypothetical protein